MRGNSVLLIIGGGIAAYKSLELIRRLAERGIGTRAILTKAGAEFVTPLSVSALTGEKVFQDLFSLTDEAEMGHIQLSRSADLVVVAPATADLIAKVANGLANDLASTALLATDKPVLMAPAMNVRMWNHPATQRNVAALKACGVLFVGPNDGEMACGEFGPGRMAEPLEIVAAVQAALGDPGAGPSAGNEGAGDGRPDAGAARSRALSHQSLLRQAGLCDRRRAGRRPAPRRRWCPARSTCPPPHTELIKVTTAREMLAACEAALPADIAVFTAAVADWRPEALANQKIKKTTTARPARSRSPPIPTSSRRSRTRNAAARSSSALRRKRKTWSPMRRTSARARAATGSSPTM